MMNQRISRRALLGAAAGTAALMTACGSSATSQTTDERPETFDPEGAKSFLLEGNRRFAESKPENPNDSEAYRLTLSQAQHPFAVILSCADSRLPPELIFDQGLGDLFTVRVAGNVVDAVVLGSIEYAVEELKTPLIAVLGHQRCGAVTAAVKAEQGGQRPRDEVVSLIDAIAPAVTKAAGRPGDLLDNAIRINAEQSRTQILSSAAVQMNVDAGTVQVLTGYYDLDTGVVTLG